MRWLRVPGALLLGGGVALTGLVVHRHALWVGGWPVPWGALLGVGAPVAIGLSLRHRGPALAGFLGGWLLAVMLALAQGPGGDFVLMSDALGWGYLGANIVGACVVLVFGAPRGRGERPSA